MSLIARGEERLKDAAAELARSDRRVSMAAADVARPDELSAAVDRLVAEQGPCDVLVTSAGMAHPGYFQDLDDAVFRDQMEVNYFGTLHAVRAVVPSMIERRQGAIVGVSSAAGLIGVFGYSAYGPTKFAVRGLMETLRTELAPYGISVGCVYPPDVDTPQLEYENQFKPDETSAISGAIKPLSADRVGEVIVKGIVTGDAWIIPDVQTRLLARAGGLLRGTLARSFDRTVRKVRERRGEN